MDRDEESTFGCGEGVYRIISIILLSLTGEDNNRIDCGFQMTLLLNHGAVLLRSLSDGIGLG